MPISARFLFLLACVLFLGVSATVRAQDSGATLTVNTGYTGSSYSGGVTISSGLLTGTGIITTPWMPGAPIYSTGAIPTGSTIKTDGTITLSGAILTVSGYNNYVQLGNTTPVTESGTLTFNLGNPNAPTLLTGGTLSSGSGTLNLIGNATISLSGTISSSINVTNTSGALVFTGGSIPAGTTLTFEPASVPEPTAILMTLVAIACFVVLRRRAACAKR